VRADGDQGFGQRRRIDVWWGGLQHNGGLMTILAYLLRTSLPWRTAEVRLKMVVPTEAALQPARANLQQLVEGTRTGAHSEVLAAAGRDFEDILRTSSRDADLIFLGMAAPAEEFTGYYELLQRRAKGLPTTVFVLAAEDVAFGEMLIE